MWSCHIMSYVFINVAKRFVIPLQGEKLLWKTPWFKNKLFFERKLMMKSSNMKKETNVVKVKIIRDLDKSSIAKTV